MSDKPGGSGTGFCDVCSRRYSWGCGHSGSQEHAARKHNATLKHRERRCECFGHDHCDRKTCKLAGINIPGYVPYYQHTEPPAGSAGRRSRAGDRRSSRSSRRGKRRRSR